MAHRPELEQFSSPKLTLEQEQMIRTLFAHGDVVPSTTIIPGETAVAASLAGDIAGGIVDVLGPEGLCVWPWQRDPATGRCDLFIGDVEGPDPVGPGAANGAARERAGIHAGRRAHGDFAPSVVQRNVRRCGRGAVLGWQGFCHPKGTIRNADRMYPKPRRALGTPGDLNAVTRAARFGRRLVANKKRIKKLERDLAKVG